MTTITPFPSRAKPREVEPDYHLRMMSDEALSDFTKLLSSRYMQLEVCGSQYTTSQGIADVRKARENYSAARAEQRRRK